MNATSACAGRIVVIEDEADILEVLTYNLERAGFEIFPAQDGIAGVELIRACKPDIVLLDVMLPGIDGFDVCRQLRADPATSDLPVIMLTARADEHDVVAGLDVGADDYVSKPFSPREVVARVQAMLRRSTRAPVGRNEPRRDDEALVVTWGALTVDLVRHEVTIAGERVHLTRTELLLLHALLQRPGVVCTRQQLVDLVMGDDAWISERTIDVHVRAIRRKLGEHAGAVETVRGAGYRGAAEESP